MQEKPVETVLYVDDDPDDQEFFITSLAESRPEMKCFAATDSNSAFELLRTMPVPKCIFIDLHLPRVNGIEILRKLKATIEFASIPTYILSTTLFEPHASQIKELGGSGYLRKPGSLQDFKMLFDSIFGA